MLAGHAGAACGAKPTINVGTHYLLPNTANQQIQLFVTGGDLITHESFWFQIGNGGIHGPSQVTNGPSITGVDLETGTIFDGYAQGHILHGLFDPQLWEADHGVWMDFQAVPAEGLIATLTVSTVGWDSGTWDFNIFDTLKSGAQYVSGPDASFFAGSDGSIVIVPEPSAFVLIAIGFAGLLFLVAGQRPRG